MTTDDDAVEHLRALVRIPTVSRGVVSDTDQGAFAQFRDALAQLYPRVHLLAHEAVGNGSLLFRWQGRDPQAAPSVLMAHQDVVPADQPGWMHPPFAAELVADGDDVRVWGRGTIDDKGSLTALFEAAERLAACGFQPEGDVYLAFGADEETHGTGALATVALLASRGVRAGFVLDEGGAIVDAVLPGLSGPTAMVGLTEKGIARVRLIVEKKGGHASTPAANGAPAVLARAILRLDRHPARPSVSEPVVAMLEAVAPHARGIYRTLFARARSLRGLLGFAFARMSPETAALVRTSRAVTRLSGSAADNVLAERAEAVVNVRVNVGSTMQQAADEIRTAIADDEVQVVLDGGDEPSPVSPHDGPAWDRLAAAIHDTFPDAVVTPFLMLAASDSRRYSAISDHVYRFLPFDLTLAEREHLHAVDESIRVSTFLGGIRFYERLLRAL